MRSKPISLLSLSSGEHLAQTANLWQDQPVWAVQCMPVHNQHADGPLPKFGNVVRRGSPAAESENDAGTSPDFPAEIRAPAGTLAGVSGHQLHFSSQDIFTPGDRVDTLVVMNPAALKTNLADLKHGGTLIANEDEFDDSNM